LQVLGDAGVRGLTHRAVDSAAGLTSGSVNYHAPTRQRLLELALDELFAQDMAVAQQYFLTGQTWSATDLTAAFVDFIAAMTAPTARFRVIARHYLLSESHFNRELRDRFEQQRGAFIELVRSRFAAAGRPATVAAAEHYVILVDGLIHRQVHFARSALDQAAIRSVIDMATTTARQHR